MGTGRLVSSTRRRLRCDAYRTPVCRAWVSGIVTRLDVVGSIGGGETSLYSSALSDKSKDGHAKRFDPD